MIPYPPLMQTSYLKTPLVTSLFWMQSSVNFILYAASNKQYREAYFLFLREVVFHLDDEEVTSSGSRAERRRTTNHGTHGGTGPQQIQMKTLHNAKRPGVISVISRNSAPFPIRDTQNRAVPRGIST